MSSSVIIKRGGARPTEEYSHDKLRTSLHSACLSVRIPDGQAESIAKNVCDRVEEWLVDHAEVTSDDIRRKAADFMHIFHPDAAYLYNNYRVII